MSFAPIISGVGPDHSGGVIIKVDPGYASKVTNRLLPYTNFPNTMRPALEKVADYVRIEMIPGTFDAEGPGWRQLSRRTQKERREQGYEPKHPILKRTGDLFKELTSKSHPKHIEIIKTGKNARIIIGGSSEKFYRNQGGNWMLHIPPRPMIPGTGWLKVPAKDRKNITEIFKRSIAESVRKRSQ